MWLITAGASSDVDIQRQLQGRPLPGHCLSSEQSAFESGGCSVETVQSLDLTEAASVDYQTGFMILVPTSFT